ncbi:YceI family protein [Cesiribacter andamanensis]|uniref:YceI-like domain protein n=1 Tax=Cesiribacter andamanensis AMV16 TaxID=1279009 RepID=M7N3L4_9BACT|nr:YceI family protein [Cesiribacter andamanensis]EMR01791.1 YceI-like domain protein [Cesiribacter andamanensis AMV16]
MAAYTYLFLLLLLPLSGLEATTGKEWLVTAQSRLSIAGSSNVNEFECASISYAGDDVLYESWDAKSQRPVMNGLITLKASGFDCQNRIMTHDLRKTIQAEKHPIIKVRFLSLQRIPGTGKQQKATGLVEISLAGISRQYQIEAAFEEGRAGNATLKGCWEFSFSDFNIEPPTKMMGAIKVNNSLAVDFELHLQGLTASQQDTVIGKR